MQWHLSREDVVKGRKKLSHKHLANNNSENCDFNIYEREGINSSSSLNKLQGYSFLFTENWRKSKQATVDYKQGNLTVPFGQSDHDYRRILAH